MPLSVTKLSHSFDFVSDYVIRAVCVYGSFDPLVPDQLCQENGLKLHAATSGCFLWEHLLFVWQNTQFKTSFFLFWGHVRNLLYKAIF